MIHLVYLSRAVHPLSDADLQHLLDQCHRNNARLGITGILFYSHGHIAQLIEGEAEVVEALYARIAQDGRHSDVHKLVHKPIAARSFPAWSMAFHPLQPASFDQLAGFLEPTRVPALPPTLAIADALLLDLVRVAVFGPDALPAEVETLHA
ncbi:hypothetical protein AUC43_18420 [Hymenobacter sedentarius]|uniref:BLUF domain-containing protein n=1 Tax=Hymenobacter sedentarius TaxID=1411621 RepID=A0A0U4CTX2_9BACT|nr:BLUF domain-containing protein [Hymenobacter sedentarius]ALW86878.1 hypothetical protein AUC43_18420 [Hymenobacter sedentarius]